MINLSKKLKRFISFSWEDPLNLDSLLNEEEKLARDSAKRFAEQYLKPRILNDYRNESGGREIVKLLGDYGVFRQETTQNSVVFGLINKEIEAIDTGYKTNISTQYAATIFPIRLYGSKKLQEKYLEKLESGDFVGAIGLTEAKHGSDAEGIEANAVKKGSKYVINGTKTWVSNGTIADIFIIWAKNEKQEVTGFVIEKNTPGLFIEKLEGKLSLRACQTATVSLNNVEVCEENVLKAAGMKGPLACVGEAKFGLLWSAYGAAESCYKIARNYAIERKQFGKPLAQTQLIQKKLADIATEISLGLLSAYHASKLRDEGKITLQIASMLKRNACQKSLQIAREARDMLGANGIIDEYEVIRHSANLETSIAYDTAADINALILGRSITGFKAF
ncbi:unnamed protein product [Blepharisma stoltei]|uniref:Acyl-CoA dehydrogenase n=1 Tax=Blepharisma stoltei TaxID=1481888 RepID=A0AAU9I6V6_9CILI|nr:unnamed protein product [Blepharisma stoltei]